MQLDTLTIDHNAIPVITTMMQNGMKVDRKYFTELKEEFFVEAQEINDQIDAIYGSHVNPKSPGKNGQVSKALVDLGVYNKPRSVAADDLAPYKNHEVVKLILEYREIFDLITKFCNTIPEKADQNDRVHPWIKHTRTATGRYACANPNLQQIPSRTERGRRIRSGFVAEDGWVLLGGDFSQIELRIPAHLSRDQVLIDAFHNGKDIHGITAAKMLELLGKEINDKSLKDIRRPAKNVNFGVLFGITPEGLHDGFIENGITDYSVTDCAMFIAAFFQQYQGVSSWVAETKQFIRRNKYAETLFGRRRRVPEVYSSIENIQEAGIRQGVNHCIQGTAADLMKIALWESAEQLKQFGNNVKMIMTIHDEILTECKESIWEEVADVLKETMENCYELLIPIKVDIEVGYNWGEMEEL